MLARASWRQVLASTRAGLCLGFCPLLCLPWVIPGHLRFWNPSIGWWLPNTPRSPGLTFSPSSRWLGIYLAGISMSPNRALDLPWPHICSSVIFPTSSQWLQKMVAPLNKKLRSTTSSCLSLLFLCHLQSCHLFFQNTSHKSVPSSSYPPPAPNWASVISLDCPKSFLLSMLSLQGTSNQWTTATWSLPSN